MRPSAPPCVSAASFCSPGRWTLSSTAAVPEPARLRLPQQCSPLRRGRRQRLLGIDMLAGGDRLLEHGDALLGRGRIEEDRVSRVGQARRRDRWSSRAIRGRARTRRRGASASRPTSSRSRNQPVVAEREAAFGDDRNQRIRQMLGRADAAGRAVDNDPDRLARHRAVPAVRWKAWGDRRGTMLCRSRPCPRPGASKVPRHIVCLTFDFDTQSGFIARGMTTPTPLSRGEFGLVGAAAHSRLAEVARHSRDLVHSGLHHREPPARLRGGGARRARGGASQLGACAAGAADPRRRRSGSRARQRGHRPADRPQGARLSLAIVGPEREHDRPPARARLSLRTRA